jgi:hypothetical protein
MGSYVLLTFLHPFLATTSFTYSGAHPSVGKVEVRRKETRSSEHGRETHQAYPQTTPKPVALFMYQ